MVLFIMSETQNSYIIEKIISGGQTGVDRAALDAALRLDIDCGGWCFRRTWPSQIIVKLKRLLCKVGLTWTNGAEAARS